MQRFNRGIVFSIAMKRNGQSVATADPLRLIVALPMRYRLYSVANHMPVFSIVMPVARLMVRRCVSPSIL